MPAKGSHLTEEHKTAISRAQLGRRHTDEENRKTSETTKNAMANPLLREHLSIKQMMRPHPPLSNKHRAAIARGHVGVRPSKETRVKLREATRGTKRRVGLKNTPEAIENMRRAHQKLWANKEHAQRQQRLMKKGQSKRPTKPEKIVMEMLKDNYPDEWKYTGDGSFQVAGLFPDFVHQNGRNMIIEVFGDYWHRGDNIPCRNTEEGRVDILAEAGYRTLVIWESELKELAIVLEKVKGFVG